MIKRIDKVANNIPIWFIYGSRSWIDPSSGFLAMVNRQDSVFTSVKVRKFVLDKAGSNFF